jgi:hypothetical protein
MRKAKNGGRKYFTVPSQGGEEQEEETEDGNQLKVRQRMSIFFISRVLGQAGTVIFSVCSIVVRGGFCK